MNGYLEVKRRLRLGIHCCKTGFKLCFYWFDQMVTSPIPVQYQTNTSPISVQHPGKH
ncbi:hypothetical protein [Pedobacter sp. JY14-1]|uniref:hypothetical protein n=1 Tax=Pedobacter sp. JY14-1 TaxID=3034151 RepID=UPI0023E2ACE2|nr:hypothetical protein [Pedobacter sp. JY14-1]